MKILIVLGLLITSFIAKADSYLEKLTVKTFSSLKGSLVKKEGSGVIVNHEGQSYILTSEHVVYHDYNANHEIQLSNGDKVKVQLVTADWTRGMALLKADRNLAGLSTINITATKKDQEVSVVGYPANENKKVKLSKGKIQKTKTTKHAFLNLNDDVIEIESLAKYGMSGGPIFTKKDNDYQLIGMSSHLFLDRSKKIKEGNDLLAINGNAIKTWIKKVTSNKAQSNIKIIEKNNKRSLSISGVLFEKQAPGKNSFLREKMSGGDPIGIGGVQIENKLNKPVVIKLKRQDFTQSISNDLPIEFRNSLTLIVNKIRKGNEVEIKQFFHNNEVFPIYSLEHFSKYLSLGYKPIIHVNNQHLKYTYKYLHDVAKDLAKVSHNYEKVNHSLIKKVINISKLISSNSWDLVEKDNLRELISSKKWDDLFLNDELDFNDVIKMRQLLVRYLDEFNRIILK